MPAVPKAVAVRLARHVVTSLRIRPGESTFIRAWSESTPYVDALVAELDRIHSPSLTLYKSEPAFWAAIEAGRASDVGAVSPGEWAALRGCDVFVTFCGPTDLLRLEGLPPETIGKAFPYMEEMYRIARAQRIRSCRIDEGRATPELAARLGLAFEPWRRRLHRAMLVDPAQMRPEARRIGDRLSRGRELTIHHPNGTRLGLKLTGQRAYVNYGVIDPHGRDKGQALVHIPSGLVGIAVDETSADGIFVANRKSRYDHRDPPCEGGEWTFEQGTMKSFNFRQGGHQFKKSIPPNVEARRAGGVLIGVNPAAKNLPLNEEFERGLVTLYIGDNQRLGGRNRVGWFAWLMLSGADVEVDGQPLLRRGTPT